MRKSNEKGPGRRWYKFLITGKSIRTRAARGLTRKGWEQKSATLQGSSLLPKELTVERIWGGGGLDEGAVDASFRLGRLLRNEEV